ncbi:MAG: hypothetical protein CMB77_03455 [Euryarchaeota archaeon]|nr:hypothetical protein [Euryarchaeota archaeon]|tara:strand:- start:3215 stop:4117 length:903 start_codon:yes stop_codon:yes gene_type:complete
MKNINYVILSFIFVAVGCANIDESNIAVQHSYDPYVNKGKYDDVNSLQLCSENTIAEGSIHKLIELTRLTDDETIYTTFFRIDNIASTFENCNDAWGLFPTAYRHITNRIIQAIENNEIEDTEWAKKIVVDFASRYLSSLRAILIGESPSYAWAHYYYLADQPDVSRTRAVVVAMVAHLTLDLPYSLVAIDTVEDQKDDYFVLGELMIEITPDFLDDLKRYYETDAEDILNGFFFGRWIDGAFGRDTTITLSYQTIRTKSWNNRWLLEQSWGGWPAQTEIWTAFWTIDGVLATLDAAGRI